MFTHHHNPLRSARLGGTLIALALTAGLAACEDDSSNKGVSAAACDAVVALGSAMSAAPQDPAEFASFAEQQLVPIGRTLVKEMTGDGKKAAETLSAAYDNVAESGDPTPLFESPDVTAANGTIGSIVHKGCDLQAVKVGAIEYAFTDIPSELDAGRVSFALENEGVEEHEMVLFKRNEGVTQPLEELLELPEEELMSKVTFTGVAFGGPGTTNYVAMDLEPGTYFLLCFIPQGEDGPPHFMGGMSRTVTVF
ncbi:MAG: hypothetical protein Q8M22_06015 [Actinomycetota bacterium]|nr:hypothetical protein [Actinomycetota bacterium]